MSPTTVRQIRDSGRQLQRIGRTPQSAEVKAAAIVTEGEVYGTYRKLVEALSQSEDVEDRKLAVQVIARLAEDREAVPRIRSRERRNGRSDESPDR